MWLFLTAILLPCLTGLAISSYFHHKSRTKMMAPVSEQLSQIQKPQPEVVQRMLELF